MTSRAQLQPRHATPRSPPLPLPRPLLLAGWLAQASSLIPEIGKIPRRIAIGKHTIPSGAYTTHCPTPASES
ncbi:hypothetical protein BCV69DRAFT_280754 [Microstroma glucosiphilum]|uniref:Uncharacterized protein n=1 Tax=Pseudomicrostroma glucosiphilum TaxID=1684307 RepID=A0A316UD21_9BASI|nr:hypothetical protein BCV69DRAFT_280754 [Pseudomicrostroma glucosiphilum]PWN23137.1 hypothetical protein BCV69DRAFT_280754 [Pseudomicrostroma glucosiphilum]